MYIPELSLAESIIKKHGTPVFVTDRLTLKNRISLLKSAFGEDTKVFYALKANYSPAILKTLKDLGIDGVDTVSPFEIKLAKSVGFESSQIIFTGNNSSNDELRDVYSENILPNIGSLSELSRFGQMFPGANVSLRFNPGIGEGEFHQVVTGGAQSKFGILHSHINLAKDIVKKHSLNIIGVHCHIGSGFYYTEKFRESISMIVDLANNFTNLDFIDIGGGFGVRYKLGESAINLPDFYNSIKDKIADFNQKNGKKVKIIMEPGKFLVAESTCLLTKVTTIKENGSNTFIGTDTGFNHIIRPAFYSAYHHILNLSRPNSPLKKVQVVGNICESSDVLGDDIEIAMPEEGDILAILTAGAYCASMSSLYNLRPYAAEVVVDGSSFQLTRERLDFKRTMESLGYIT